jgi:hypothetical protein
MDVRLFSHNIHAVLTVLLDMAKYLDYIHGGYTARLIDEHVPSTRFQSHLGPN